MKALSVILYLCVFGSCGLGNSKFIRKKIGDNNITIKWYYYSYITSTIPDIVRVEKDGRVKEIYKATQVITDVMLKGHNIILKLDKPSEGIVFTEKVRSQVFGYRIVIDTTATDEDLRQISDGIKE